MFSHLTSHISLLTCLLCVLCVSAVDSPEPVPQDVLESLANLKNYLGSASFVVELVPVKSEVIVTVQGSKDVNGDGKVDAADLLAVKACFNSTSIDCLPPPVRFVSGQLSIANIRRAK